MIDQNMAALGIGEVSGELTEDALEVLCGDAEAFLRAGGTITRDEWRSFNAVSRAAYVEAGNSIWRERMANLADAIRSEAAAAYLRGEEEGRAFMARKAVEMMVANVLRKRGVA